eukprot:487403-Alexandrium_andersonii.AAC.1
MRFLTADAAPSESAHWLVSTPTTSPASAANCSCNRALCSCNWFTAQATSERYATMPRCVPELGYSVGLKSGGSDVPEAKPCVVGH